MGGSEGFFYGLVLGMLFISTLIWTIITIGALVA
tara:strand:+ start:515 stop:616 length:102 start_codon:yes stop_codon:yes gene_type:complete